jgi:hypothetical protein
MFEYYLNNVKASIKYLSGFLTICFKLFIVLCIFYSGVFYANSNKTCMIEIHKTHETVIYSGVKAVM